MKIFRTYHKLDLATIGGFAVILIAVKWILISYGLPYQVHVDEITILKEPFKLAMEYSQGNFTHSTNLLNWIFLGYSGVVYIIGLLIGAWSGLDEFKLFIISDSGSLLLIGRILSLLISSLGALLFLLLVFKMTHEPLLRFLLSLVVLFNPIEWNSTNWVKFEAYSYLLCALILNLAYDYFVLGQTRKRFWLYIACFVGVALRIELIAYLVGLTLYDFFFHSSQTPIGKRIVSFVNSYTIGVVSYCLITLTPVTWVFSVFHSSTVVKDQTIYPTFEKAITSKIPAFEFLADSIFSSTVYLQILLALLGPVILLAFALSYRSKQTHFIYLPFLITLVVLLVFPVKNTHYLLGVSVLLITSALSFFTTLENKKIRNALVLTSLLWTLSFSFNFLKLIVAGDVRIDAREFLLKKTQPNDVILVEGIFSQIYDTPSKYLLRSEAAREIGSTGLSSSYMASNVDPKETRELIQVSDYDAFKGTKYESVFTIAYDSTIARAKHARYFVYVARIDQSTSFKDHVKYQEAKPFFEFINKSTVREKEFTYRFSDPRLVYSNFYYFHPVSIFRFMT